MVAKRSGTRPLHGCGQATQPPHRAEVFDLNDALSYGRLRFAQYVDSPEEMARGGGSVRDRYSAESAFVPRTPDNGAERMQPPRADPEHLALVVGLLASANKRVT
jgi:hypothetical protein